MWGPGGAVIRKIRLEGIAKIITKTKQKKTKPKKTLSSKIGERLSKHSPVAPASWSLPSCDSVAVRITGTQYTEYQHTV